MKPNFFIVGTPKAGTTSLYFYLEEHPEIYMSPIKETNYFSFEDIKQQGLYYDEEHVKTADDYNQQFADVAGQKAIGEASVSYLFYPAVPARIKAFNPDAKIIIILRNPVDRAFSHYLMDKRLGFVNYRLEDIMAKKGKDSNVDLFYQQYIELGSYYEQVKRYIDTFGRDNVKVFLYEDIIRNINSVVKEVYQFLGVNDNYKPATENKHNVFLAPKNPLIERLYALRGFRRTIKKLFGESIQQKIKDRFFAKEKKPVLSDALKSGMLNIYKADILKTAQLINRDLNAWLK